MKETQILKANHLSKNDVITADDTGTVSPNVDKNNKIIRINLKSTKNQVNHLSIHEKRSKSTKQKHI